MSGNRTFTMLKPDTVESNNIGNVTQMITDAGFVIKAMKLTQLSKDQAKEFYSVHKERPFYGELVEYMTSGPIVAAILEKDNAVEDFRNLIGSTDPSEAEDGTIRKKYAESKGRNAVHGSDSDENAQIEANFHFNKEDLV
jgi:nucleoside-diphosphate kinase